MRNEKLETILCLFDSEESPLKDVGEDMIREEITLLTETIEKLEKLKEETIKQRRRLSKSRK